MIVKMTKERLYPIAGTVAVVAVVAAVLLSCSLSYLPAESSPWKVRKADVELMPGEYIPLEQMVLPDDVGDDEPAKGEPVQGDEAAPGQASGGDLEDAGEVGATLPQQTASELQPMKQRPAEKPDKDAAARRNEERERHASQNINTSVNNAFTSQKESSSGNNHTAVPRVDGGNVRSDAAGVAPGARIGNGWSVSHFGFVGAERKPLGSVVIEVEVDAGGNVVSVSPAGGTPPAASDANVVAECLRAARQSRFSRKQAGVIPERTRGTLTWTFR